MSTCSGVPASQFTGPLVLGYQFNWALYGVLGMQLFIYTHAKVPEARVWTKVVVWIVFLLETAQIVMTTHDAFHELALSWGDCAGLTALYWAWLDQPIFAGITTAIIQCSYAYRVSILSRSWLLAGLIVSTSLMQMSASIAEGMLVLGLPSVADTQVDTYKSTAVRLGGTFFCDILIAFSMMILLFRARRRTDFKDTQSKLNRLIRLVIETGMTTAIVAIIDLTLFLTFQRNYYHVAPALMLSKLYSISYLVFLNSRVAFAHADEQSADRDISIPRYGQETVERSERIQITIDRETFTESLAMIDLESAKAAADVERAESISVKRNGREA
ncbi:hypothetical protein CERSUDRAFT_115405 [Gelatoporia subvermispora B]|uniref:DUF6534 domain-containing protein n=1 Tax=Ceriporiopsis subvermispora (strain B) TaxID=914234 RepID=M2QH92_CERS8|nr:hypothetical protein CERSUDRAFT_115405 [Gelatoporia subvermispora B]